MVALPVDNDHAPRSPEGGAKPLVWVMHDGKAGMASQALGLAEATGFPFVEKSLTVRAPWAYLPPQLWLAPLAAVSDGELPLRPPWPNVVIGCGRNTAAPALAIRRLSGGRTIAAQIQDPRLGRGAFDLMVVPEHDHLRGPRVITSKGALNRVTQEKLAEAAQRFPELADLPRPILGVLIGGANRAYSLGVNVSKIGFKYAQAIGHGNPIVMFTPTSGGWLVQADHQVSPACKSLLQYHP